MQRTAQVSRIPMSAPDDVSGISTMLRSGLLKADSIVAVLGKTEGNGCVNDYTRGYASHTIRSLLAEYLSPEQVQGVPLVMSGGTEGGLSPHWLVFSETLAETSADPALAMASSITRALSPEEIGRSAQAQLVRSAVIDAMLKAGIEKKEDVHFVQVKCPLLSSETITNGACELVTNSTLKSMNLSRAASALGVALALNELPEISDKQIGSDFSAWSSRASCSSGVELDSCEVIVFGLSQDWAGPLRIDHTVMQDAIDAGSINQLLGRVSDNQAPPLANKHILAVLAKAEASTSGEIRGMRHTMLNDSDIASTRHARAFTGGLIAGLIGHTELFVSGGAEHQGPDGGGPLAIIYSVRNSTGLSH